MLQFEVARRGPLSPSRESDAVLLLTAGFGWLSAPTSVSGDALRASSAADDDILGSEQSQTGGELWAVGAAEDFADSTKKAHRAAKHMMHRLQAKSDWREPENDDCRSFILELQKLFFQQWTRKALLPRFQNVCANDVSDPHLAAQVWKRLSATLQVPPNVVGWACYTPECYEPEKRLVAGLTPDKWAEHCNADHALDHDKLQVVLMPTETQETPKFLLFTTEPDKLKHRLRYKLPRLTPNADDQKTTWETKTDSAPCDINTASEPAHQGGSRERGSNPRERGLLAQYADHQDELTVAAAAVAAIERRVSKRAARGSEVDRSFPSYITRLMRLLFRLRPPLTPSERRQKIGKSTATSWSCYTDECAKQQLFGLHVKEWIKHCEAVHPQMSLTPCSLEGRADETQPRHIIYTDKPAQVQPWLAARTAVPQSKANKAKRNTVDQQTAPV